MSDDRVPGDDRRYAANALAAAAPMGGDSQLLLAARYPEIAASAWLTAETWWHLARTRPTPAIQAALCSHRNLSAEQVSFATRFRSQRARRALVSTNYPTETDVAALLRPTPGKPLAETMCNTDWIDPETQLTVSVSLSPDGAAAWLGGQADNFDTATVVGVLAHRFGGISRSGWHDHRAEGHLARALDSPQRAIAMLAHRDCGPLLASAVANTTAVADPAVVAAVARWAARDPHGDVIDTLLDNPWTHRSAEATMPVVSIHRRQRRRVTGAAQQLSGDDLTVVATWATGPARTATRDGTPNVGVLLGLLANPNYAGPVGADSFMLYSYCDGWDPAADAGVRATFDQIGQGRPHGHRRDRIESPDYALELNLRSAAKRHRLPLPRVMPPAGVMTLRWLDTWRQHPNADPKAWLDVAADKYVPDNWLACLALGWALGDNVAAWEVLLDSLPADTTIGELADQAVRAQPSVDHQHQLRGIREALSTTLPPVREPKSEISPAQRERLRHAPLATFPAAEREALAVARDVADEIAATGSCAWTETDIAEGRATARLVRTMLGWPIRTHRFPPNRGLPTMWAEDARPPGALGVSADAAREAERHQRMVSYLLARPQPVS